MGVESILSVVDSGATLTLATLVFIELRALRQLLISTLEQLLDRVPN